MSGLADRILALPAWVALLLVFAMPLLEASVFLGLIFPGEITVILGGVLASEGKLPLAAVLVAAYAGAIIGDNIGYAVGRRYGAGLLDRLPSRLVPPAHVERAATSLNRLGGRAVVVGRFTAALRAFVPGLCGMAHMRYRKFLVWNVVGGVFWATAAVMLGYVAGTGYQRIESRVSIAGYLLLAVIILGVVVVVLRARHRRARAPAPTDSPSNGDDDVSETDPDH